LQQTTASSLPPFAATCYVEFGRILSFPIWKGMVSNQNTGFPIPESRQKFRSAERIKLDEDGALNGRSETGSETEPVGSEMNGRRRSGVRF
jgi:hypothetical protein